MSCFQTHTPGLCLPGYKIKVHTGFGHPGLLTNISWQGKDRVDITLIETPNYRTVGRQRSSTVHFSVQM